MAARQRAENPACTDVVATWLPITSKVIASLLPHLLCSASREPLRSEACMRQPEIAKINEMTAKETLQLNRLMKKWDSCPQISRGSSIILGQSRSGTYDEYKAPSPDQKGGATGDCLQSLQWGPSTIILLRAEILVLVSALKEKAEISQYSFHPGCSLYVVESNPVIMGFPKAKASLASKERPWKTLNKRGGRLRAKLNNLKATPTNKRQPAPLLMAFAGGTEHTHVQPVAHRWTGSRRRLEDISSPARKGQQTAMEREGQVNKQMAEMDILPTKSCEVHGRLSFFRMEITCNATSEKSILLKFSVDEEIVIPMPGTCSIIVFLKNFTSTVLSADSAHES
ncbi:hypothetical protein H6P81_010811 [Aristolochia fimbriata]|uniref:Uncharacterized protein n=1 Tax=Aristolochia fimbriata TaxID=158543 RepID=A0AAV7EQY9_ARIFI|nr:hypothetical protein H6P81_010811 [Aristolochia fimbriata]